MSKIICDVCGTSFPETATQCPICGCVRSADVEAVVSSPETTESANRGSYTYVKGGRFSKANVKKRNAGKTIPSKPVPVVKDEPAQTKPTFDAPKKNSNAGLVAVIVVLLLAIFAVLAYIAIRFVVPNFIDNSDTNISQTIPDPVEDPANGAEDGDVACVSLSFLDEEVYFTSVGETFMVTMITDPEDTTDVITFVSENEEIATVDADGVVTAVSAGETTITATCGECTAECVVVCDFEPEVVEDELLLDGEEHTFTAKGETWTCYTGEIPVADITWSSDDETIATVSEGVVTAVGAGTTNIRAKYNDQEVSCAIICNDTVNTTVYTEPTEPTETTQPTESTQPTDPPQSTDPTQPTATPNENYRFNTSDKNEAAISVGQRFNLKLLDENKKPLEGLKFSTSNARVCTVTESGQIKGIRSGTVKITAEYNGALYVCKIYVR